MFGLLSALITIFTFASGVASLDEALVWLISLRDLKDTRPLPAVLTLHPVKTVTLELLSNVSDAAVYLDGEHVGTTPLVAKVSGGRHRVLVTKPPCEAMVERVDLASDESRTLRFPLRCQGAWLEDHPRILRDKGVCPFEGCIYREWKAQKETLVYSEPQAGAAVKYVVRAGSWVTAVTGEVITTMPGRALVKDDFRWGLGGQEQTLRRGDIVHTYTYKGEGAWTVWYEGNPIEVLPLGRAEVLADPESTWWVYVLDRENGAGWVKEAENFSNNDIYS
jgi:hypothetical protein